MPERLTRFRVHRETEPNFHLDIQEDVTEECSKYGKVLQCHVVRDSPSGLVYLRFESSDGGTVFPPPQTPHRCVLTLTFQFSFPSRSACPATAAKAIQALNGRWFAGKVISAEFIDENTFAAGCKL
jgi:RNA-binding protein 39